MDEEVLDTRRRPGRGRWPRWLPWTGAALLAAAALVVTHRDTATDGRPIAAPSSPSSSSTGVLPASPASNDARRAQARLEAESLLTAAPIYPGASRVSTSLAPALDGSGGGAEGYAETAHAWWTTTAPLHTVVRWFTDHPPAGWVQNGTGDQTGPNGLELSSLYFATADGAVTVSVAPTAAGAGIRVDTSVAWQPVRPGWDHIARPTKVAITVRRAADPVNTGGPGAATVRRTLAGAPARHLATLVDHLDLDDGPRNCPADLLDDNDTLRFATPAGAVTVVADVVGCRGVDIAYPDGRRSHVLGGDLDGAVLALLHLPANYGLGR